MNGKLKSMIITDIKVKIWEKEREKVRCVINKVVTFLLVAYVV